MSFMQKHIIKALTKVAVLAGIISVSQFSLNYPVFAQPNPNPKCSARPGYPLGRWKVSTKSDNTPTASCATFVTFTRPKGGTWLPSTGQGSFEASAVPAPGAEVILKLTPDAGGSYVSTNKLVVSPDGCRMLGTASDTQGHRGEVKYTWNEGS